MLRILNAESRSYSEKARQILSTIGEVEECDLDRSALIDRLPSIDVLIVRLRTQIDQEVLDAGRRLRAIVTATTGLDHIDLVAAGQRRIEVLSLRGETAFLRSVPATAEHTWGLLLSLVRKIPASFASVCRGEWERDRFRGRDLRGRKLGIVGLGRIGDIVARYGDAFGMEVHAFDPFRVDWPTAVTRHGTLRSLLGITDVVSLHVPLNEDTRALIGPEEFSWLAPQAILVNTSRGEVVDTAAMVEALKSCRLAGAALDVLPEERGCHALRAEVLRLAREHSNLIVTPHIGGATVESMAMTEVFMAEKLVRHFSRRLRGVRTCPGDAVPWGVETSDRGNQ